MELVEDFKEVLTATAKELRGSTRRLFMARLEQYAHWEKVVSAWQCPSR